MAVEIAEGPFDPWERMSRAGAERGSVGATACFVGTMRDVNEGDRVRAMTLEHYPGMTERQLEALEAEARRRWALDDVLVVHRVGALRPSDPIVLVAVWSGHRREAFEACRYLIEELKTRAPFWKKEHLEAGSRWVRHNTPDDGD